MRALPLRVAKIVSFMFNNRAMCPVLKFVPVPLVFLAAQVWGATGSTAGDIQFNRDIRPIISENCFACHGADSASRKAGLRLDRPEDATAPRKDTDPAIVPGKPDASLLIQRINASDPDDIMPPVKSHKVLTAEQKDLLKR